MKFIENETIDTKSVISRLAELITGASVFFESIDVYGSVNIVLENNGFAVIFENEFFIRLYEYSGCIFFTYKEDGSRTSSMVTDQNAGHKLWGEVTDVLLAS